jgi:RHS repeat-associated protein
LTQVLRSKTRTLLSLSVSVTAFAGVLLFLTGTVTVPGAHGASAVDSARPAQASKGATGPSTPTVPSAPLAPSGADAYMNVPNSVDFDFGSAFSFEIWVNPGANPFVTYRAIACNTLYPSQGWLLATDRGGGLIFQTGDGGGFPRGYALTDSVSLIANSWNQVVATETNNNMSLYLNGQLVATGSGNESASSKPLEIGHGACDGLIVPSGFSYDHAALYHRVLPASEVLSHYNNPSAPPSPAPVSLWRLDETSTSQAAADDQGLHPGSYVNNPILGVTGKVGTGMRVPEALPPQQTYGTCGGSGEHALAPSTCTADPVNSLTGAFTTSATDLTEAATGVSFAFTRSYTSADTTVGRLGPGWTDSYATSLAVQPNGDVIVHGEEGQQVYYSKQPNGSFVGAGGALSTLSSITGGYKLVTHDQITYTFNTSGVLQSQVDRNGQGLTFTYTSGKLTTITDAAGHAMTLAYNASNLLSSVGTPDNRMVAYGYTSGRLTSVILPDPDDAGPLPAPVWTYTYDANGRLWKVIDPNTKTQVTNLYDPSTGRVTDQTDARNKTTHFAWDPATQTATATDPNDHAWKDVYENNLLVKRIDPAGETTTFGYDTDLNTTSVKSPNNTDTTSMSYQNGNLVTATAPASLGNAQKIFTYDAQNNVRTVTDARTKQTVLGYDANGNNNAVTVEGQPVFGATFNAQGQMLTSTDGNGKTSTYTYDAAGNLASVTAPDPDGAGPLAAAKTTYTYDTMGNVLTRVDPLGNCSGCNPANYTTTYTYDRDGNLLTESDPLGHTTAYTYDAAANLLTAKDANNHVTTSAYDDANHLIQVTRPDPDGAGPLEAPVIKYTYDDAGNRVTLIDPLGNCSGCNAAAHTTTYAYDQNNRLASVTTPKGEKTTYTYDANGNRATMVDPRGNVSGCGCAAQYTTTYTYDAAGRLLTTTDPLNHTTTNHYDAAGNLDWTKDANQHQTSYTYDAVGRILTVQAPDGGLSTYTYDGNGNLKTEKDDNNHVVTLTYDDAGRLIQVTAPNPGSGAPVTSYAYDLNGNVTSVTDPNGNATPTQGDGTTSYTYDRANRLTNIGYSDATPPVTYGYDNVGNRTSMTDGSGTVTYAYDNVDRLTGVTRGMNTFGYGWDVAGNLISRTYPDSTSIAYGYDEDNRLTSAATGGVTTSYGYDPAGHLTQTTLPSGNGYVETRTYDNAGRLIDVKNAKGASVLSDFVSTLDPAGNPTQIVQAGTVSSTQTYTYDANDRVLSVCFQAGTCPGGSDPFIRWTYDKVGNRLTEARPTGVTNYTYNALDELTQAGSTGYSYDANGNETASGSRTFGYDLANRLKTTTSGSTTTTYTYDGDGNRLQASTGTQASKKTNFLWDTGFGIPQLALERDGNNALLRRYTYGAHRIAMFTGGASYYYHYDALGSMRNLTSATGVTQWTDTYEPFGVVRTETKNNSQAPANFMKFTAEYNDPTGLYYLRARQYDPATGGFLAPDPISLPQEFPLRSRYVYVAQRPTLFADPTGETMRPSEDGPDSAVGPSSGGVPPGELNTLLAGMPRGCAWSIGAFGRRATYTFAFPNIGQYSRQKATYRFSAAFSTRLDGVDRAPCNFIQHWHVGYGIVYDSSDLGDIGGYAELRMSLAYTLRLGATGPILGWAPSKKRFAVTEARRWPADISGEDMLNTGSPRVRPVLVTFSITVVRGEGVGGLPWPIARQKTCALKPVAIQASPIGAPVPGAC